MSNKKFNSKRMNESYKKLVQIEPSLKIGDIYKFIYSNINNDTLKEREFIGVVISEFDEDLDNSTENKYAMVKILMDSYGRHIGFEFRFRSFYLATQMEKLN